MREVRSQFLLLLLLLLTFGRGIEFKEDSGKSPLDAIVVKLMRLYFWHFGENSGENIMDLVSTINLHLFSPRRT